MKKILFLLVAFPFLISAQQNTVCFTVDPNPNSTTPFNIFTKYVDVLGRTTTPTKDSPLFYIYENGKVEKRLIID